MAFSEFLNGKRAYLHALLDELGRHFAYVSVLGTDVRQKTVLVNRGTSTIGEGGLSECGFVVKMHDGRAFYEYSFDNTDTDPAALAAAIVEKVKLDAALQDRAIACPVPADLPHTESFYRPSDFEEFSEEEMLSFCTDLMKKLLAADEHVANAMVFLSPYTVDKLFISRNRELDQHYGWCNGMMMLVYNDGRMVMPRADANSNKLRDVMDRLPALCDGLLRKARGLAKATPIEPGVYDIITDSSITGLIAHEAFGHGVEMDQFVKDRALAKQYMGKYVASPISNMRDGAAATLSAASYFFDDDGVIAHDTQIIRDGILVSGLCDLTSACELGVEPTGNGRRESFKRKAYTRMTNTFFDCGTDRLEDMIASVKHGYMLFETNNGMEDPKNWQIQCTAEYGIEIVDGHLTDHYVSPVVISGSVPDLLKSISMISNECEVHGSGSCGKGYKEWVRVSDGGPVLKARAKLA